MERVQRRHLNTKEANAYLVGKMALCIWNDECDPHLFKIAEEASIFFSKLIALINDDPMKSPSLASVLNIFISSSFKVEFSDYY